MRAARPRVLLDTSYLLPVFGVAVDGIGDEDLEELGRLIEAGALEPYMVEIQLVEIAGKLARLAARPGPGREDVLGTLEAGYQRLARELGILHLDPGVLRLAAELRLQDHRDMFDNLLYALAKKRNMLLPTIDEAFRSFLEEHGHDTGILVDHHALFNTLAEDKRGAENQPRP